MTPWSPNLRKHREAADVRDGSTASLSGYWQMVLQKSFWGEKRSRSFVSLLQIIAAAESSKNQL
jgi:hypothetical protein